MRLDDLAQTGAADGAPPKLERFRANFAHDFGEFEGTFEMDGAIPVFRASYLDRPVVIQSVVSPRGVQEYVINGNSWYPPGDFATLSVEQRRQLLGEALTRYAR